MKKRSIFILFTAVMFIGSCSGIQNKFLKRNLFCIKGDLVKSDSGRSEKRAGLLIRQLDISPEFESNFFVYRISSGRYTFDYYNKFMVAPARMITDAIGETLYTSPFFKSVPAYEPQDIKYQLWGKIIDIYGDIQDKNHPKAVITLRLILEKREGTGFVQIINKIYPASVPLTRFDAKNLITAWDICLRHIVSDFYKDLPFKCSGSGSQMK